MAFFFDVLFEVVWGVEKGACMESLFTLCTGWFDPSLFRLCLISVVEARFAHKKMIEDGWMKD